MDKKTIEKIAAMYRDGKTQTEISRAVGVVSATVKRALEQTGITPRWKNTDLSKDEFDARTEEMLKMHLEGKPYREIAERFEVSSAGAYAAVQRAMTRKAKERAKRKAEGR